jgi:hypothetical protein
VRASRTAPAILAADDPTLLVPQEAAKLRVDGVRFFVSTGPGHSHWIPNGASQQLAHELRALGLRTTYRRYADSGASSSTQVSNGRSHVAEGQGSAVECRTCR